MPSSSELVSRDQEKVQWHGPKKMGGGEEMEVGATRDSVCECSSTLSE